jgi:hypothetical protein
LNNANIAYDLVPVNEHGGPVRIYFREQLIVETELRFFAFAGAPIDPHSDDTLFTIQAAVDEYNKIIDKEQAAAAVGTADKPVADEDAADTTTESTA